MQLWDFHHHHLHEQNGIYNLDLFEDPVEFPFSVGLHPKDISQNWEEALDWVKETAKHPNCWAIGECGLDAQINIDRNLQKIIYQQHLLIANDLRKPVIIHCVKLFYDLIPFQKLSKTPMIIHGFNKKQKILEDLADCEFYFSFGKALLHNVPLQKSLEKLPLNRFFLETDNANFPIVDLYLKVAEIKKINLNELINQQFSNLELIRNG